MAGSNRIRVTNTGGTNGVDFSGSGSGAEQGIVISDGTNVRQISRTTSVGGLGVFTVGMIMPFYGSVGGIPSGWVNCDGTNNTPNLNDKFILGTTSNSNVDTSGGNVSVNTVSAGGHTHTITSTTLTSAMIPAHAHFIAANYDEGSFSTNPITNSGIRRIAANGGTTEGGGFAYKLAGQVTTAAVSHGQTSWAYTSSPDQHTHTITSAGQSQDHMHAITDARPPFHRLLYIMYTG